jgi:hypothetical protein
MPRGTVHLELPAVLRIFDFGEVTVCEHVRIVGGFEQRVDRRRDDVGAAEDLHPLVARARGEKPVERREQRLPALVVADDDAQIREAGFGQRVVEAERGHRFLPFLRAVELEDERLALRVVEAR